eukprot:GEMP01041568.1.p1 GENE.GEMP01041568.1~~GEMP01041568.1.p1  ORF type:complete len:239 (+),score=52.88 GEMP01041568.1:142-858(+)
MVTLYCHVPSTYGNPLTLPLRLSIEEARAIDFGDVKHALIQEFVSREGSDKLPHPNGLGFYNECEHPVNDATIVEHATGSDFFLKAREYTSLPAEPEPVYEKYITKPLPATPGEKPKFNAKQSPFGTDIQKYESLTAYTWEDGALTVKAYVTLEGVGKLPPENIRSNFGRRQFELLVDNYGGKNFRFACSKTHGFLDADKCKHVVRANRINLLLKKEDADDTWFDLFKGKAVGEKDYD